jgi:hypothetical protein
MQTIAFFADTHCNHKYGLNLPTVDLDEGDQWKACELQRALYHTFEDCIGKVKKKKRGKLTTVLVGDVVELDAKGRTHQIITRNIETAVRGAISVLEPLAQISNKMYFVKGTEAHVGESGFSEASVAGNFDNAIPDPATKQPAWWHLLLDVDGVRMDIAHHPRGGSGGRPQNSQAVVDRLASDTLFEYANDGLEIPNLVIRAHIHQYKDSHDAFRVRAFIVPPFRYIEAYTRRIGITMQARVGCVLVYCDKGQYEIEPIIYEPKRPQWVKQ